MVVEEMIVNSVLNLAWILGGIAAFWAFLAGFLIVRIFALEKQIKLLTATVEANLYKKRNVLKHEEQ